MTRHPAKERFPWPRTLEELLQVDQEFCFCRDLAGRALTNQHVYALSLDLAECLRGYGVSDKVYARSDDALVSMLAFFACMSMGILYLPLNPKIDGQTFEELKVRWPTAVSLDALEWNLDQRIVALSNETHKNSVRPNPIDPGSDLVAILSSGTTAAPKAIFHSLESLAESASSSIEFYSISSSDRMLLSLGLFHIGGLQILMRALLAKACILIGRGPRFALHDAQSLQPSILSLVPTQLYDLLNHSGYLQNLKRRLRLLLLGGAACPQPLYEKALQEDLPISLCYGASESGAQIVATDPRNPPNSADSAGQILPWRELRLESGVLQFRGWGCARGIDAGDGSGVIRYDRDQWIASNDRAEWEGDCLRILGRLDDVLITGGENINLSPLKRLISEEFSNAKTSFLTVDDERMGQRYEVLLESADPPAVDLVERFFTASMRSIERPRAVFWAKPQPVDGKRSKRELLRLLTDETLTHRIHKLWPQI